MNEAQGRRVSGSPPEEAFRNLAANFEAFADRQLRVPRGMQCREWRKVKRKE
jgi:hypothetical protein